MAAVTADGRAGPPHWGLQASSTRGLRACFFLVETAFLIFFYFVAGGTEAPIIPVGLGGFVACRALSQRNDEPQRASRPWDTGRDGFVMGEGAGESGGERGAGDAALLRCAWLLSQWGGRLPVQP